MSAPQPHGFLDCMSMKNMVGLEVGGVFTAGFALDLVWICMEIYGYPCKSMQIHRDQWKSMQTYANRGKEIHANLFVESKIKL